jgi:hypothetical protein
MGLSFDFSGFEQLSVDLDKISSAIVKNEAAAVHMGGLAYQRDVQLLVGEVMETHTGLYRASIRTDMETEGTAPVALVGTPAVQAKQLEYGGVITVKNAKALHWVDDEGVHHFAQSVTQPGHPHFRPAWDQNREKYGPIMMAYLTTGIAPGGD